MDKPNRKTPALAKKKAKKAGAKKLLEKSWQLLLKLYLRLFCRSKKGVDAATLMKKTEFDQKKINNIIYKLKKQGKIKSVGKVFI